MTNLFERRATEYLRDSETFLSIVTPEPLRTFLEEPAKQERLYDRLVLITGTPGSGKTTIAQLLQFHLVDVLRRNQKHSGYKELVAALVACAAIDDDGRPLVAGVRVPLESEYRDFWQLPYAEAVRTRLVLSLLQARAVLGWFRNITARHYQLDQIRLVARAGTDAATAEIGGLNAVDVHRRAVEVERAIYRIGAALVPPPSEDAFEEPARAAYRPFDVLEAFELPEPSGPISVRPLVMLDDAHNLHPDQLAALNRDLARRELRIARWVLTRLDVLTPTQALLSSPTAKTPQGKAGPQLGRDVTVVAMQRGDDRANERRAFRRMARDMADRYLRQMPEFARRQRVSFADLLETAPEPLPEGSLRELAQHVDGVAEALRVSAERRAELEAEVARYLDATPNRDAGDDIRLAMLLVLMHRYGKRVPQRNLFGVDEDFDPKKPLKADTVVAEAARIHLHHDYGRPYYYGIDTVCDAASENAEQFLHLAAKLVDRAETRLVRNRSPVLESRVQQASLKEVALKILEKDDYPFAREALALADGMAVECLKKTLEPNGSLGGGANAWGVPQKQFVGVVDTHKRLASVLQFAVAYNVITLVPNYGQGKKIWCLLELGGCMLLKHGLTPRRGGFLEKTVANVASLLPEEDA